jgi:hypothetical protein
VAIKELAMTFKASMDSGIYVEKPVEESFPNMQISFNP